MKQPLVYVHLPPTGLGNMLYVWANGWVLAERLGVEPVVSSWTRLHLKTLLRRERSSRLYWKQLRSAPWPRRLAAWWRCRRRLPFSGRPNAPQDAEVASQTCWLVSGLGIAPNDDSFRDLKDSRAFLQEKLEQTLELGVRHEVLAATPAWIGIHVRRGDFRHGSWLTPIEYFCERLRSVRAVAGTSLPAVVFSDGTDEELAPLLEMDNVTRAPRRADVVDLLVLSRSRVIIASGVSTFSNWASFLCDGLVIRNPRWIHQAMRPAAANTQAFEGTPSMDPTQWPEFLVRNLAALADDAARASAGTTGVTSLMTLS